MNRLCAAVLLFAVLFCLPRSAGAGEPLAAVSESELARIVHEGDGRPLVLVYWAAQNIVVFKTLAGLAGGACEALDHMDINGIVGTLAGENTVFVVMRDNASAETFCQEIQEML